MRNASTASGGGEGRAAAKRLMLVVLGLGMLARAGADELSGAWTATASSNHAAAPLAVDRDPATAWRSAARQKAGEFLQIDLTEPCIVREVQVFTGTTHPGDFPRGLAVSLGLPGEAFAWVAAEKNPHARDQETGIPFSIRFNPRIASRVRLELTTAADRHWSVAQVRVYGTRDLAMLNTRDVVVVAPTAPPLVRFAAADLREYLSRLTGRYLALVPDTECVSYPGIRYAVGRNALTRQGLGDLAGLSEEAILLRTVGNTVVMAGNSPRASAWAAYRLLHRLGVRWYSPGDRGEYVPPPGPVELDGLDLVHEPSIPLRRFSCVQYTNLGESMFWTIRNCLSGVTPKARRLFESRFGIGWTPSLADWPAGTYPHSFQEQITAQDLREHPDVQPMFDGKRRLYSTKNENFCTSSPEAVTLMVGKALAWFRANPQSRSYSICPQDAARWCECERCQALDAPLTMENFSRAEMRNVSDRYFTFINAIAARVAAEFPDRVLTTIAYANWHQPPRFDVHPNVLVNVCQYGCSAHAVQDASCARNREMHRRMLGWRERVTHLGVYDYVLLNADAPRTPHPYGRSVAAEIKWLADELKIASWWSETFGCFWRWSPAPFWLAFQLGWDAAQDPEALLDEFMRQYYGPADGARDYWRILRERVHRDGIHFRSYNAVPTPELFEAETLRTLRAALARATDQAPAGSVYAERVSALLESLQFVTGYLEQLEVREQQAPEDPGLLRREAEIAVLGNVLPVIDGNLDDAAWQRAARLAPFVAAPAADKDVEATTTAYVAADASALYIAVHCLEPEMARLQLVGTQRDHRVWLGDSVDLFLQQDNEDFYYHITINADNVCWDARHEDGRIAASWNPEYTSAALKEDAAWSVELALPWAALGWAAPQPGATIRANLCRQRCVVKELSSWSQVRSGFLEPGAFGTFRF